MSTIQIYIFNALLVSILDCLIFLYIMTKYQEIVLSSYLVVFIFEI